MSLRARPRVGRSLLLCLVGPAVPAASLLVTGREHLHLESAIHFGTVGASALVATAASVALTVVGARRSDARTVLVGTAFFAMAALLFLHGLASPGVLVEMNGLVAFSGAATLPAGGAVLALSALPTFRGRRAVRPLLLLQAALLVAIATVGIVGLLAPDLVPAVPETGSTPAVVTMLAGLAVFGFLALRALDTYLLTLRVTDALVVLGLAFLANALVGALMFEFTELGWWLGHAFEVVGLGLVGAAVVVDLRRARQSRPLTGGLPAADLVAAEETFLGAQVKALTLRLAEKDGSTEEHTRRVALRAVLVGEELGLAPERLRALATGGLLHDIGKLAVPDTILKKPGPLSDDEYGVVCHHPEWGHRLLGELGDFSDSVRRLVLDHHERLDGTGYPRGLADASLDLETRILAVCDVYDALVSSRVYREAWSHADALAFLYDHAGGHFDRRCVAALDRVLTAERSAGLGIAV